MKVKDLVLKEAIESRQEKNRQVIEASGGRLDSEEEI